MGRFFLIKKHSIIRLGTVISSAVPKKKINSDVKEIKMNTKLLKGTPGHICSVAVCPIYDSKLKTISVNYLL